MGKPTGFLEYEYEGSKKIDQKERIKNYDEFFIPLSKEKQQIQGARCMECGVPFCQSGIQLKTGTTGCPLNNLIPEWNDLIYNGHFERAYKRLKKTNNFPEFTSRVCPAPCQAGCTCGLNGNPVSIKENEYGIIEDAYKNNIVIPEIPVVRTKKKIAIIGSGPSGLAAADQLNQRGHYVTVYERNDRIGGLLMYGIPNMKLDKNIINRKVNLMKEEGVKFITNADVGKNVTFEELNKEYDKIILSCGASKPRDIKVLGREGNGIFYAVDFLKKTTKSLLDSNLEDNHYISAKDKHVVVIGGGDTGNDCVGTSIRQGAKSILQVEIMGKLPEERRSDNPWPEWPRTLKTDYGQEEAKAVFGEDPRIYNTTVKEFINDKKGNLKSIKLVNVDENFNEIQGSEFTVKADLVLIAAGFVGCEEYIVKEFQLEVNKRGNVDTKTNKYETTVKNVYVAGDMRRGQSLVVWAIKEGRDVAKEVDKDLMGYTNL